MTELLWWFTGGVFAIFILDWLAVGFSWRKLECVLKPASMVMVILWTLIAAGWSNEYLLILLVIAQVAGLSGDIFLLLSSRWFLLGLGAFLVGHLIYIGIMLRQLLLTIGQFGGKETAIL